MTWGAVVHCFDNGITIITDVPVGGASVMGVKKDGNPCYAVESDSSPALPNSATVEYRDANNDLMVTVYTSDTGTAAECPGTDVAFTVPTGSTCMTAITGVDPIHRTLDEGTTLKESGTWQSENSTPTNSSEMQYG